MPTAKGSASKIQVDFESTFAADPGVPSGRVLPFNSCDLVATAATITPGTITGNRNPVQSARGNVSVDGSIVVPVDLNCFGFWLKGLLGAPTTTGASDPYTHTYKVGASIPSMVIEKMFTNISQYEKFNGCKINSMKLGFGGDGELVATLDIMGAKQTLSGTTYDSTPTAITLDRVSNFQAALKEGGSAISIVTAGEINFENGLDGGLYCVGGSGQRGDIPEGFVKVSGSITALFQDLTLLNKALAATESSMELTFTSGTHSLAIKIPELTYERTSPAIKTAGGLTVDMKFNGYYNNDGDATSMKVVLISSQASFV